MFSGIIEEFATVVAIKKDRENIDFTLKCSFTSELKIDQSVAHNGVCLTVVAINGEEYVVTAMKETLDRTNLGLLKVGDKVNVERSMLMNGRLDGHIVQGHVDETATCIAMEDADGSTYFTFEYPENREMAKKGYFTVDKGSVTVNGVSLTVCNPTSNTFQHHPAGVGIGVCHPRPTQCNPHSIHQRHALVDGLFSSVSRTCRQFARHRPWTAHPLCRRQPNRQSPQRPL